MTGTARLGRLDAMTARHLLVHGVVQGVGFRWSLAAEAERRGVHGWVRNREDGTVEAQLEGAIDAVQAVADWARTGPRHARVSHVEITAVGDQGAASFEIEP